MYAAALVLSGTACDDSEYDLQTLVPDAYHAVVNVQDDVNKTSRIFDTGRSEQFEFTVLRGGSDPSIGIEADVVPMTQEELAAIGAGYVVLPAEYYTATRKIFIPAGKGSDVIAVSIAKEHVTAIREMNEALEEGKIYCLALKLESANSSVYEEKGYIVRRLDVMQPELGFGRAGEVDVKLYDANQDVTIDFAVVRGLTDETLPVKTTLVPLTQAELSAVDPAFMAVPANLYTLPETEIELPAGTSELTVNVTFTADQIGKLREKAEAENKKPVLSFRLVSENSKAITERGELLYVLDITQPILQFEYVSGAWIPEWQKAWWIPTPLRWTDYQTRRADCWGNGVTFRMKMPEGINNTWTIRCKPAYDPSYIDAYNAIEIRDEVIGNKQLYAKQKTPYQPLPDTNDIVFYDANGNQTDEIVMAPGQNEVTFTFKRRNDNWSYDGAGLYLCPIVATTDLFPVDRQDDPVYVLFYDEITLSDKTLWEPSLAQQGQLSNLYNEVLDQIWHTPWDQGNYIDQTYGQYFQINIKQYQPTHGLHIGIWPRSDDNNSSNEGCSPRHVKVLITSDNVPDPTGDRENDRATYDALNWVEVADLHCDATCGLMWLSPKIDLGGRKANAIRICSLTKGNHQGQEWSCTAPNDDGMKQYIALGAFKIWGN